MSLAGCGGSGESTNDGNQYLQITGPANRAAKMFNTKIAVLPSWATVDDVAALATTLAAAFETADHELLRGAWPASARQDLKTLVGAEAIMIADLTNVSSQNVLSISTWEDQLSGDIGKVKGQVDMVRSDLHVPPSST